MATDNSNTVDLDLDLKFDDFFTTTDTSNTVDLNSDKAFDDLFTTTDTSNGQKREFVKRPMPSPKVNPISTTNNKSYPIANKYGKFSRGYVNEGSKLFTGPPRPQLNNKKVNPISYPIANKYGKFSRGYVNEGSKLFTGPPRPQLNNKKVNGLGKKFSNFAGKFGRHLGKGGLITGGVMLAGVVAGGIAIGALGERDNKGYMGTPSGPSPWVR